MTSTIHSLAKRNLIRPPKWLPDNTHYETVMGSIAYGVATDTSDFDVYGFCIPPRENIFPHLAGEIPGFGRQINRFNQYQEQHIMDADAQGGKGREYDLTIYSIVKYFQLVMENNPNMVDSLYTPLDCVLHITKIGQMVRDARDLFLHKGAWHKFRGYAYSQLSKIAGKTVESKRYESVLKYGYDVKFAYHTVRLVLEVEQILTEHTIDLRRNSDLLKAIRQGEWTEQQVREWFAMKEKQLDGVYNSSTLRYSPDETAIKALLLACLEEHYSRLDNIIYIQSDADRKLRQIREILG